MWTAVVSLVIVCVVIIDGGLYHKELGGQSNNGTGGLSIGGKIGVGVGVVGGAFVLAVTTVLGICLCCKKKHGYEPLPGSSSSLQVGGICCSCACVGVCRRCRSPVELPQIIQQPVNQLNVVPGTEVWFTVAATGEDLAYKWQRDGASLLEEGGVSGTTTNTLTITSVQKRDSGTYKCVVSNDAGGISSDSAELTLRHVCNCPEIKCISKSCKCNKDGIPCVPQCHCKGEPGECLNPKNNGQ